MSIPGVENLPPSIDLGGGHRFEFAGTPYESGAEGYAALWGGLHYHPRPDNGEECAGAVAFAPREDKPEPQWQVHSLQPLTLSPSVLCRICGCHGFIRNGRWENA